MKSQKEINEKEMKETIVKINKTKSWFFEKINKIDKPLARVIIKKERRIKSTKLEMKKEKLQQTMQKYKTKFHLIKAMVFPVVTYGCESWTVKKAGAEELMFLNCGVGENS